MLAHFLIVLIITANQVLLTTDKKYSDTFFLLKDRKQYITVIPANSGTIKVDMPYRASYITKYTYTGMHICIQRNTVLI